MKIESLLPKTEIQRVFDNFHVVAFQDGAKGVKYPATVAYVLCDGYIYTVSNHANEPTPRCVVDRWHSVDSLDRELRLQKQWRGYKFFSECKKPERHIVDYEFFSKYEEA